MKVLVTGASGFVGSHTAAALAQAGHDLRLLVRDHSRLDTALRAVGMSATGLDVVKGDVSEGAAIAAGVDGCDALVHCANVYSFDVRDRDVMEDVNVRGTGRVLGLGAAVGLDPMIHVSSFVALLPAADRLGPDSPVGDPQPAYARSKAAADRVARRHQESGEPVVVVYPGIVWGPADPFVGESARLLVKALRRKYRLANGGIVSVTDVRDLAASIAAMVEPGRGARRYMVTGHDRDFRALVAEIGAVAGKNLWSIRIPHSMAMATGRSLDRLRARFGWDFAINHENPWLSAHGQMTDNRLAREELGIEFRPLQETIADTVGWLREAGHL